MKLLMIDDDVAVRSSGAGMFRLFDYEVIEATNGDEALAALTDALPFDVVISDYDFGTADIRNGVEICTELRPLCAPDTRFIVCSGLDRDVPEWISFCSKGNLQGLIDLVQATDSSL